VRILRHGPPHNNWTRRKLFAQLEADGVIAAICHFRKRPSAGSSAPRGSDLESGRLVRGLRLRLLLQRRSAGRSSERRPSARSRWRLRHR
jgi:hypothetical protein